MNRQTKFLVVFLCAMGILAVVRHGLKPTIPAYEPPVSMEETGAEVEAEDGVDESSDSEEGFFSEEEDDMPEALAYEDIELEETEEPVSYAAETDGNDFPILSDSIYDGDSLKTGTVVNKNTRLYKMSGKIWSYKECLPDTQEQHLSAALKYGIKPVATHSAILGQARLHKMVSIMDSPFFVVEKLDYSMPYLVPAAKDLLTRISLNFLDSLQSKGMPLCLPIVTSVTRTTADVKALKRRNRNATDNSCHSYGTTFDITYSRYMPLTGIPTPVDSATWQRGEYKMCLAEVLYDLRSEGFCYVKHERRQPCFHITVRRPLH